jgi:quinol monooxygenase YgiN
MTIISKSNNMIIVINVMTVEPNQQQHVVDLFVEIIEKSNKEITGFHFCEHT